MHNYGVYNKPSCNSYNCVIYFNVSKLFTLCKPTINWMCMAFLARYNANIYISRKSQWIIDEPFINVSRFVRFIKNRAIYILPPTPQFSQHFLSLTLALILTLTPTPYDLIPRSVQRPLLLIDIFISLQNKIIV